MSKCLKRNKTRPFSRGRALAPKTRMVAEDDLKEAEDRHKNGRYKYAAITAYYSMFHSAKAPLYAKNYREHSHYCLAVAIRALYVEASLLPVNLVEALAKGKRLREDADYYDRWSEEGAEFLLKAAKDFLQTAKNLLKRALKKSSFKINR